MGHLEHWPEEQGGTSPLIPTPTMDQFALSLPSLLEGKGLRRAAAVTWKHSTSPEAEPGTSFPKITTHTRHPCP